MIYVAVRNLQFQKFEIVYFAWVRVPSNFKFEMPPARLSDFKISRPSNFKLGVPACLPFN